jgi:hypothetical protein
MSEIAVSNRVVSRNRFGRFIADCEQAAGDTAEDLVKMGARLSKERAPTGAKDDLRTIPLKQSIQSRMLSRTSGVWEATARHSLAIEFGAVHHLIVGNPYLQFYWEAAGRQWVPGLFGEPDIVNHPGNEEQPYLRPAYDMVMAQAMAVARQHYP